MGCQAGRKRVLSAETSQFVSDTLRRKDRANDGLTRQGGIDLLQDLEPQLTLSQCARAFDRNVRVENKEVLTGIVKAQSSTVKRSAITVQQQWRWHKVSCGTSVHTPPTISHLLALFWFIVCRWRVRLSSREKHRPHS